jgi:hypothetical protein
MSEIMNELATRNAGNGEFVKQTCTKRREFFFIFQEEDGKEGEE